MRSTIMTLGAVAVIAGAGTDRAGAAPRAEAVATQKERPAGAGKKLYMDVHHLGAGKVTAKDVAGAHKRDLEVGGKYNVRFLKYWFNAETGTIRCLAEAPSAEAAIATHKEAHGLLPESIEEVSEGE
jgi:hypothetical protein